MSLRERLDKQFFEKVYPNPKDPTVTQEIADGRCVFDSKYMQGLYPWKLGRHTFGDDASKTTYYQTRCPANRSVVIGTFPQFHAGDISDLDSCLCFVREAGLNFFKTVHWKERIQLLLEISNVTKERFWLLVATKMYETGQSLAEAIGETDEEVDFPLATAMYLEELHEVPLLRSPSWSGDYNGFRFVPHGTFLNIEPFNFPGAIPMDMAVKALSMGNSIIMKPSDKSSLCGYLVYESIILAFQRLGIPHECVVNYCPGGPEVVDMLLASEHIAGISFTGSSAALSEIKQKHGTTMRYKFRGKSPLVFGSAETSGVNVMVVWEDADVPSAALECAKSFLGRSGQKCSSARVIMVHEDIYNAFCTTLEKEIEKARFGDVLKDADLGPVITRNAEQRIGSGFDTLFNAGITSAYTKQGQSDQVAVGLQPVILYGGNRTSHSEESNRALMNTELFGPVTTVVSVSDLHEVRALCNCSEFALTGGGITENVEIASEIAEIIPAGNLYINRKCTGALAESECFGGLSSRSSPTGIKGRHALPLFGSMQTTSGFYGKTWSDADRKMFIKKREDQGFVFSKT